MPCGGVPPPPPALPCEGAAPLPLPLPAAVAPPQEIYSQNNGQPVVVYAYPESTNELSPADLSGVVAPAPLPLAPLPSAPGIAPVPVDASADLSEVEAAQQAADSDAQAYPVENLPQSDVPCRQETDTQVLQQPGETFVHHPGSILINQPPTRLIINHAPFLVKPSPIILNQGGKTITKAITRKYLPSQIQVRPVIVRVVKPIEKKVFIDKPAPAPGCNSYASNPAIPAPCSSYDALPAAGLPIAGLPVAGLPSGALQLGGLPAGELQLGAYPSGSLQLGGLPVDLSGANAGAITLEVSVRTNNS